MTRLRPSLGMAAALLAVATPSLEAQDELERCEGPVGTLAVVEPQDELIRTLRSYQLESPTGLIRMMVQETNCFIVVERGIGMQNMMQERELSRQGELRQGENVGPGQMEAADFILTPDIVFSEGNSGGVGGAVGGLLGRRSAGVLGGGLKFKEAQTSMVIANSRTGVQVAAADGQAKKTDFSLGALGITGGLVGAVGGYTNTNEGKVIAASYADNLNNIVKSVRGNPMLPAMSAEEIRAIMRGETPAGGASFTAGDVVVPKIDNIPLLSGPADGSGAIAQLKRSDNLVFLGTEENGFIQVQASAGVGWVRMLLVDKM